MLEKLKNWFNALFLSLMGFIDAGVALVLNAMPEGMARSKSGQLISNIIGSVIGVIMFIAVAIPVTTDIIATANVTGTTLTIINLLPLFYAIGALLAVVGGFIIGGLGAGRG